MQKATRKPPRPALSATRALRVLDFLAAHPGEAFTLSDVARRLSINVSSTFSILNALEEDGWIRRDPARKTYHLGFAPIAVGHAALDQHPVIQLARECTAKLAKHLGLECLMGAVVGAELVILAEAGDPRRLTRRPRVGQRLPNTPAMSVLSAAYADRDGVEAWLDRLGPGASRATRRGYREAAALVRARGFEIGIETPTRKKIGIVLAQLVVDPQNRALHDRLHKLVAELAHEGPQLFDADQKAAHRVNHISAPIFDSHVRCIGGLTLLGFDKPLHAPQIERYTRILIDVAEDLTRATGGTGVGVAPMSLTL
jgi:DNA-binding IclR family transcriptional regulator